MSKVNATVFMSLVAVLLACDPPPDEIIDGEVEIETDTGEPPEESEADTETEEDTEVEPEGAQCLDAVLCLTMTPEEAMGCFDGMDDADREAATDLALCMLNGCMDATDDLTAIAGCLILNCPNETLNCIGMSMF